MTLDNRTKRWFSQKWIFDSVIRSAGVESFTAGSMNRASDAAGMDMLGEMNQIRNSVKKFNDITRQCKRLASVREGIAKEFESQGKTVSARENYFIASMLYGCARWSLWDDEDRRLSELTNKITQCYQKYTALADHFIQRIEIPFEGKTLYAYLHLPPRTDRESSDSSKSKIENRFPCVVIIPGMDTFKEELVRQYGDRFLQRGFSVLAVDGPGQGETIARGLKVTIDNYDRAGKAIMDYLVDFRMGNDSIIDPEHVAIVGASFGSYWGPRIMANDQRYSAGAFSSVCHEPHMETIFNGALPSFKARHMWMCGIYDESEFDSKYRTRLSLEDVGEKIKSPIFIAGGEDDPLSPIKCTLDFFGKIATPKKKLLVYEGEEHGIADPLLSARMADFVMDAFKNNEIQSGAYFMERVGTWKISKPIVPGQQVNA